MIAGEMVRLNVYKGGRNFVIKLMLGTTCKHGGVWNCMDRYNPGYYFPHKWENAFTIDKHSWSHRRNSLLEDYLTPQEIINQLVTTVCVYLHEKPKMT